MNNAVAEIQNSNEHISYEVLFKKCSKIIYKSIYNFIEYKQLFLSDSEVDDIFQEIALKMVKYDYLSKYNEGKSSLITWLTIICRTSVVDYCRKNMHWKEAAPLDSEGVPARESVDETLFSLPAGILTRRQEQVITLFFKDGLVAHEIAEALGISVRTVRSLKFQALERLRKYYGANSPQQGGISHER